MDVSTTTWLVTMAVLLAVIVADLFIVGRNPREPSMREATAWVVLYVSLAVIFGIGVGFAWGTRYAGEFFAGLAYRVQPVDRQPVRVRDHYEPVCGASAVSADRSARGDRPRADLPWVVHRRRSRGDLVVQLDLLPVRAFLIWTAVGLARHGEDDEGDYQENVLIRTVRRVLPTTRTTTA